MPLQINSANSNAPDQEILAPWRSPLARAIHRNRAVPFSRYFQLATVQPDGNPANRTVVFRGFLADTNWLMMVSDRRSEKNEQISHNANVAVCWYFTKTREQFRLSGQITAVTADTPNEDLATAREQIWQKLSDSARTQFTWPQPKSPRSETDAFNSSADSQNPPSPFSLLLLDIHYVDHLELRGDPQNRCIYHKKDSTVDSAAEESSPQEPSHIWQVTPVNP